MVEMSITRALREAKLLQDRIEKKTYNSLPVTEIAKGEKPIMIKDSSQTVSDFRKSAAAEIQSIEKLIDNLLKVRSAILKANNETVIDIKIGKKTQQMTIAESIDLKNKMGIKKQYLAALKKSLNASEKKMNDANKQIDLEISTLRAKATDTAEAVNSRDSQIKELESSKYKVINPENLIIRDKIAEMEEEIENFESEIDYILSEVNAKTVIEVDYGQ